MAKIKLKKQIAKADNTSVKKPNILESRYSDSLNKSSKLNFKMAKQYQDDATYRQIPGSSQQKFSIDEAMRLGNIGYREAKEYEKSKNKLPNKK